MICRTFFCQECYQKHSPKFEDFYVLYHAKKSEYSIHQLSYNPHVLKRGFTPHLINVKARNNDEVMLEITCGIYNCGISFIEKGEDTHIIFKVKKTVFMSSSNFKALLENSDLGYRLEDN